MIYRNKFNSFIQQSGAHNQLVPNFSHENEYAAFSSDVPCSQNVQHTFDIVVQNVKTLCTLHAFNCQSKLKNTAVGNLTELLYRFSYMTYKKCALQRVSTNSAGIGERWRNRREKNYAEWKVTKFHATQIEVAI